MKTITQFLAERLDPVWSVKPDDTVIDALRVMADKNIGALVVIADDRLVGIFSERDYARKVVLMGKSSSSVLVRDIMTSKTISITPGHTVEQCMQIMSDHKIRHLPILKDDKVVGMISIGDVVKAMIATQKLMIEQLQQYITT